MCLAQPMIACVDGGFFDAFFLSLWFVQRKVRDTAARKAPGYVEKMEWISIISTFRLLLFFFAN